MKDIGLALLLVVIWALMLPEDFGSRVARVAVAFNAETVALQPSENP